MKWTRASYPGLIGMLLWISSITINAFSERLFDQIIIPILIIFCILVFISVVLAIKDKEFVKIITDERTKRVDRSAGYYSWLTTILFVALIGIPILFLDISITSLQIMLVIFTEMWISLVIFHLYFNFKGEIWKGE